MVIEIIVRDDKGQFVKLNPSEFAETAIIHIIRSWGWDVLRFSLFRVFMRCASDASDHDALQADRWISRYQSFRNIP